MLKYFSDKNKYVVDEPSLWTINGSVDIQYAGGTKHESGKLTVQVGNIESYVPIEKDTISPYIPPTNSDDENNNGDNNTPSGEVDPTPQGGGNDPGTDPGTDPTPSGDMIVRIKLVNGRGDTVRMERLVFYITPLYNVTDCYANINDTIHSGIEVNNINVTLQSGEYETFTCDISPYVRWLQQAHGSMMTVDTVYWQNGPSHDGGDPVIIYTTYYSGPHWSEDYHTNVLSGKIIYGQEYTFTIQ